MDLPGVFQWQASFMWINFSFASQIGKSDWMLTERAESAWNNYLDTGKLPSEESKP
jgi:hypothetical protein